MKILLVIYWLVALFFLWFARSVFSLQLELGFSLYDLYGYSYLIVLVLWGGIITYKHFKKQALSEGLKGFTIVLLVVGGFLFMLSRIYPIYDLTAKF